MNHELRVVSQLPLSELWDSSGVLAHRRGRLLGVPEIVEMLGASAVRFAVADVGRPLMWIMGEQVFSFWKEDAKPRIVAPANAAAGFRLEDYPSEYAYIASEWNAESQPSLVVLECHH